MTYQHFEKFDMISVYIESGKNEEMAQNLYFVRYPERRQPFKDIFRRLEHNLKTYGSFTMPRSKTYNKENKENEEISVLGFVEANNQVIYPVIALNICSSTFIEVKTSLGAFSTFSGY